MTLFTYFESDTIIHKLNPMIKILALGYVTFILIMLTEFIPTLYITFFCLFLILGLAKIPPKTLLFSILPFLGLIIGLTWFNIMFPRCISNDYFMVSIFKISKLGFQQGITIGTRIFNIVLLSYLFSMTTRPRDLCSSLIHQGRVPYKLAFSLFIGFQFIPLLSEEYKNILVAHRIRGKEKKHRLLIFFQERMRVAIPLFTYVIRKSYWTGIAMESRAFGAYSTRTYLKRTYIEKDDIIFLILFIAFISLSIIFLYFYGFMNNFGVFGTQC